METSQWNNDPAMSCHHLVDPQISGSINDIEKQLLNDTQFVPFDEDTLLAKVRSMCSLLDYSAPQATYMETDYEYNGYLGNAQMESSWSDETNGVAYSQHATLGSCLRSFNEELAMNCPYF